MALLGLVLFQGYWIRETVSANRQQFEQNVYEALNTVVHQLERKEALLFAHQSFGPNTILLDTAQLLSVRSGATQSAAVDHFRPAGTRRATTGRVSDVGESPRRVRRQSSPCNLTCLPAVRGTPRESRYKSWNRRPACSSRHYVA